MPLSHLVVSELQPFIINWLSSEFPEFCELHSKLIKPEKKGLGTSNL